MWLPEVIARWVRSLQMIPLAYTRAIAVEILLAFHRAEQHLILRAYLLSADAAKVLIVSCRSHSLALTLARLGRHALPLFMRAFYNLVLNNPYYYNFRAFQWRRLQRLAVAQERYGERGEPALKRNVSHNNGKKASRLVHLPAVLRRQLAGLARIA